MGSDTTNEIWQNLRAEAALAAPGNDEGLLPVYSLLGDLTEAMGESAPDYVDAMRMREAIEELFLSGGTWTEAILADLNRFLNGDDSVASDAEVPASDEDPESKLEPESEEEPIDAEASAIEAVDPSETDVLMVLDLGENSELLEEFVNEASEHLDEIENALLKVEHDPQDEDSIHSLFRSFHTIKGVSGFLELVPINKLSHDVESLLDLARNHKLVLDSDIISVLLQSRDRLLQLVQQVQIGHQNNQQPDALIPVSDLITSVRKLAAMESSPAPEVPEVEAQPEPEPTPEPQAQTPVPEPQPKPVRESKPVSQPVSQPVPKVAAPNAMPVTEIKDTSIRVNIDKLDTLVDSVGELVILESQLLNSLEGIDRSDNSQLQKHLNQLRRIVRSLQNDALAIRMVPVRQTFRKMERLARELSRKLGKNVDFLLSGEDTELDRTMVEVIGDPLVHMIRNAVDHGLEDPETRINAGKNETGTIKLSAFHQGGYVVLELRDDGRGLNAERIHSKAIEKGLVQPNHKFTQEEIYHFIFLPGFSTAEKLTDVSGRGVGLDVVRKNIEGLRGKVEINSEAGNGTVFSIKLPLTLAIIEGLVVKVAGDTYILPATSIRVALKPEKAQLKRIHGRGETLSLRGEIIPLFYLSHIFDSKSSVRSADDGIVVVIDAFNRTYGLVVDELISKQEVVIKSLGPVTKNLPGLLGGAILGDGSIALIVDPVNVVDRDVKQSVRV